MTGNPSRKRFEDVHESVKALMTHLTEEIEAAGGQVLSVSEPLSLVTVQARRDLIKQLTSNDQIRAIMENQQISLLDD